MKRRTNKLARILFNTLTVISLIFALVLSVALVVSRKGNLVLLWAFHTETITPSGNPRQLTLFTAASRHRMFFGMDYGDPGDMTPGMHVIRGTKNLGTRAWIDWVWNPLDMRIIGFVGWPVPIALGCVAWLAYRKARQSQQQPGHCPSCGYDTRANPSRCSECGQEIALKPT